VGDRSTDKLVVALIGANAPDSLVVAARKSAFHDFKSDSITPSINLVRECERNGLPSIAQRARQGEFDAGKDEADAWAESPDGVSTFRYLSGGCL
jgi:hypothetical protein